MKKVLFAVLVMILATTFSEKVNAQTFEHSYNIYHADFYVTDLGNNDYKYVVIDSSGFRLFNLNHTLYLTVVPPIPIWQPSSGYNVSYISKTLFDCDSSNIEYVITANSGCNYYIYRTDGTLIFERDSVTGGYCYGCFDGSIVIQPIANTPAGAKLFLHDARAVSNTDSQYVYALCGTLPETIGNEVNNNKYVQIFPNPTNGEINFKINLPNNWEKFKLTIYDGAFQQIDEADINGGSYQLDTKQKHLSTGTYLFDLRTEKKIIQTGKFIITE